MDIVYRFGKFQTKEREAMVRRYSFFGLIEYRRYGFGGVYLIVGRKWFTIDEFIKQAKEMVKTKTYQYNSGYQKPAGTPYNPQDDKKDAGKKEKPRTRIGAGWAGTNPPGQSSFYDDEDDYYDRLYGGGFRY